MKKQFNGSLYFILNLFLISYDKAMQIDSKNLNALNN